MSPNPLLANMPTFSYPEGQLRAAILTLLRACQRFHTPEGQLRAAMLTLLRVYQRFHTPEGQLRAAILTLLRACQRFHTPKDNYSCLAEQKTFIQQTVYKSPQVNTNVSADIMQNATLMTRTQVSPSIQGACIRSNAQ